MAKTHEHFLHFAQPTPTLLDITPLSQRHKPAYKNKRERKGDEWHAPASKQLGCHAQTKSVTPQAC